MQRIKIGGVLAVIASLLTATGVSQDTGGGRTYVLVHGAYAGGSAWRYVAPLLRAKDHAVYTPTLTGLGDRADLANPDVDLDTHIDDIVSLLLQEDLHEVVLVGWSYSGMVVSGVLDRVPGRLAHVVYVDAEVPRNGDSGFDFWLADDVAAVEASGDWQVSPGSPEEIDNFFGNWISDTERRRWFVEELGLKPQPIKTFSQPIELSNPESDSVPRTFIRCPVNGEIWASIYDPIVERVSDDPRWNVIELASNHLAPIADPELVADTLLDIAVAP